MTMEQRSTPVIGYRSWLVAHSGDAPRLWSLGHEWCWHPQMECHAVHMDGAISRDTRRHRAPVSGCDCGIYATHWPYDTRWLGPITWDPRLAKFSSRVIHGAIALSGRVIRHEDDGVRGERGRLLALVRPGGSLAYPRWTDTALLTDPEIPYDPDELAAIYGVPLVTTETALRAVAMEHGEPLWPGAIGTRRP
jgi:hypothetical protein